MAGQLWSVNSLGGFLANPSLSKKVRYAAQPLMKFRQFVDAEPAAGRNRHDTFLFDKISNISTAGGTLSETETIPKRSYVIRQGSLVVTEYGNAVPFTLKGQTLAEISVPDNIKTVLRNDMAKVLDSAAAAEFKATDYIAVCSDTATTVFTSNSTVAVTATANMSDKNVRDIIDRMKSLNIPRYDGQGNYICIASTNSIRGLYDFFEAKVQNTSMGPLYNGEIGKYYACRFMEETNVLLNTIGSGGNKGEAIFFGGDAVKEGMVIPENIRIDIPKDFGRDQSIAWYALTGFKKTWDFGEDGETRIIYVKSA
jgi:N4-gp56 family major capsid protein